MIDTRTKIEKENTLKLKNNILKNINKIGPAEFQKTISKQNDFDDPMFNSTIQNLKSLLDGDVSIDDISKYIDALPVTHCEFIVKKIKNNYYNESISNALLQVTTKVSEFKSLDVDNKNNIIKILSSKNDIDTLSKLICRYPSYKAQIVASISMDSEENIKFILDCKEKYFNSDSNIIFGKMDELLKNGNLDLIKIAIDYGWNPAKLNNVYIRRCAVYNNIEVFKYLVENCGANPAVDNWILMENVIDADNLPVLKYMISNYKEYIDFQPDTIWLRNAARHTHNECYRYLVSQGILQKH